MKLFNMRLIVAIVILAFVAIQVNAQNSKMGMFAGQTDIGTIKIPGTLAYDASAGTYNVGGSGQNVWAARDDFSYVWKKIAGDFTMSTDVKFVGDGINAHRKVGIMLRHSLEPNSPYADACVHGDGLTALQYRRTIDNPTEQITSAAKMPKTIRLRRAGDTILMSTSMNGTDFESTGSIILELGNEAYLGIFMCSHGENDFENAIYSDLSIIQGDN